MEKGKNQHPGFVDGLKASNIALNKVSLNEYSEQILSIISLLKKEARSIDIKSALEKGEVTITSTLKNKSPNEIINDYIKFGDISKSIIQKLSTENEIITFNEIAIKYLQIAKYTTDSRIKDIAISIAKEIQLKNG